MTLLCNRKNAEEREEVDGRMEVHVAVKGVGGDLGGCGVGVRDKSWRWD